MQNFFSNRIFVFVLGLIIGAGLLWLVVSNQDLFENNSNEDITVENAIQKQKSESKKKIEKPKKIQNSKPDLLDSATVDTLNKAVDESMQFLDSLELISERLKSDSVVYQKDTMPSNEIILMKDELILIRNYKPSGDPVAFHCDVDPELDSLLVDNKVKVPKDGLMVEFWKSPVNFKGYRLSRTKLVLFGIFEYDNIEFRYYEGKALMMKYKNKEYILKCGDEFIPLNLGVIKKTN